MVASQVGNEELHIASMQVSESVSTPRAGEPLLPVEVEAAVTTSLEEVQWRNDGRPPLQFSAYARGLEASCLLYVSLLSAGVWTHSSRASCMFFPPASPSRSHCTQIHTPSTPPTRNEARKGSIVHVPRLHPDPLDRTPNPKIFFLLYLLFAASSTQNSSMYIVS